MSEFTEEFDYIISRGWWFSVIPKAGKWRCSIYRLKPDGRWEPKETRIFPSIIKGMVWIEAYLTLKLDEDD